MWRPDRFKYLHQVAQFVGRALNWQEIPGGGVCIGPGMVRTNP